MKNGAPQNQGMVSPSHVHHSREIVGKAHEPTLKSARDEIRSIEQERGATLIRFPSGKELDAGRRREAFRGDATIVAISRVARDVSAKKQQVFAFRADGKREADNDRPQTLRKNLIFY